MTEVCENDWVLDDFGGQAEWRQVVSIVGNTLYMADGGVMGMDEVKEVMLPSEAHAVGLV